MTTTLPELPDFCWPVDTSCIPGWDALENPDAPESADNPRVWTDAEQARAVSMAGQTLRLLTGFRVGGCPVTVRPAGRRCREQTWRTYPVVGGSTPWQPVSLGGQWLNITCGHGDPCGCLSTREVRLLGPVGSVESVTVDGVVLDADAWRLDVVAGGARLVRLDGEGWPLCQNLAAPPTEPDTWAVTYTPGQPVDGLGAHVAGILAAEYLAACRSNLECRLPAGVQTIQRQGVTLTLAAGAFPGGRTGILEVDTYLERWNPGGLRRPSAVWSPDLPTDRRSL